MTTRPNRSSFDCVRFDSVFSFTITQLIYFWVLCYKSHAYALLLTALSLKSVHHTKFAYLPRIMLSAYIPVSLSRSLYKYINIYISKYI